jgi:hypothetical protein
MMKCGDESAVSVSATSFRDVCAYGTRCSPHLRDQNISLRHRESVREIIQQDGELERLRLHTEIARVLRELILRSLCTACLT